MLPAGWSWHDATHTQNYKSNTDFRGFFFLIGMHGRSRTDATDKNRIKKTTALSADTLFPLFPLFYRSVFNRTTETFSQTTRVKTNRLWALPYWHSGRSQTITAAGAEPEISAKSFSTFFPFWWRWNHNKNNVIDAGNTLPPVMALNNA